MNDEYARWLACPHLPEDIRRELENISDASERNDRFYRNLSFGTGGMRGVMGAGTNRMNELVIAKATRGFAEYLCDNYDKPSVCIGFDTRNNSAAFADKAAQVMCAQGVEVYMYDAPHPTPMVSFAVRHLGASAGIVVTASHNPKEYNGYKVYNHDGGQITDAVAADVFARIESHDVLDDCLRGGKGAPLHIMGEDVEAAYFERVRSLILRRTMVSEHAGELRLLYTPLNGSGNVPVRRMLREAGYTGLAVVKEQEQPDGDFPTTPYPNPEERAVYAIALKQAQDEEPDIIFATDPDCDRIGILCREGGEYVRLTGNQVGALLCDYIIGAHEEQHTMPPHPAVIKTIVTSDMCKRICAEHGTEVFETLTGFKYIGELAEGWSRTGERSFLLGFEESYGYVAGDFVRDKDAVIASTLIAEAALYHKLHGRTLYGRLRELFDTYGYFCETLTSRTLTGADGQQRIKQIMQDIRKSCRSIDGVAAVEDYAAQERFCCADGSTGRLTLPASDVVKLIFTDGSWLVLRPSGTEPKLKVYVSAAGADNGAAQMRADALLDLVSGYVDGNGAGKASDT